jgi:hypothetical protein
LTFNFSVISLWASDLFLLMETELLQKCTKVSEFHIGDREHVFLLAFTVNVGKSDLQMIVPCSWTTAPKNKNVYYDCINMF